MLAYATHGAAIRAGEEHSPLTPWHTVEELSCEGHPADGFGAMGETSYCDGSCR